MVFKHTLVLALLAITASASPRKLAASTASVPATSAPATSAPATSAAATSVAASSAPAAASSAASGGSASGWPTTAPNSIKVPSMQQTTSTDPATECVVYTATDFPAFYDKVSYPQMWVTATTGTNTSAEFQAVYNAIDWSKAPNINVRTLTPSKALDMTGYDTVNDPDCWWSATGCTTPKVPGLPADISACPEPETWGLTYDDGPNCSHNAFYDYLQQNNLKASMFYIGSNIMDWPYGAVRGLQDGHHIAVHTWSHQAMTTLNNQELVAEFYYTKKAIKYTTGVTPLYWRPPLGDVDDRVRWVASQMNLTAILWNQDTTDWQSQPLGPLPASTVQAKYQAFIQMGSNGTYANTGNIVLTHEINNTTMSFALQYIPQIKAAYKNILDVATCMNISHPYVEDFMHATFGNSSNSSVSAAGNGAGASAGTANSGASTTAFSVSSALLVALIAIGSTMLM